MLKGGIQVPTKRYVPKNKKHELSVQAKIATYLRKEYPHVDFHSDYAAGMWLSENQARVRRSLESGRGWPDMTILYPSRSFHGLVLELKKEGTAIYVSRGPRKGQLVANEQIQIEYAVLRRLDNAGYCARFAVGYERAIKIIDWYFERPQNAELF